MDVGDCHRRHHFSPDHSRRIEARYGSRDEWLDHCELSSLNGAVSYVTRFESLFLLYNALCWCYWSNHVGLDLGHWSHDSYRLTSDVYGLDCGQSLVSKKHLYSIYMPIHSDQLGHYLAIVNRSFIFPELAFVLTMTTLINLTGYEDAHTVKLFVMW